MASQSQPPWGARDTFAHLPGRAHTGSVGRHLLLLEQYITKTACLSAVCLSELPKSLRLVAAVAAESTAYYTREGTDFRLQPDLLARLYDIAAVLLWSHCTSVNAAAGRSTSTKSRTGFGHLDLEFFATLIVQTYANVARSTLSSIVIARLR